LINGRLRLALSDALESLQRRRRRLDALPRQTASQEVDEHVRQRLQIVSPTLLCPTPRKPPPPRVVPQIKHN